MGCLLVKDSGQAFVAIEPELPGLLTLVVVILFRGQSDGEPFAKRVVVRLPLAPAAQVCRGKGPLAAQMMARSRGVLGAGSPARPR